MGKVKITNKRTGFQRFVPMEIGRGQIANAPYNPRRITAEARARLKRKIEEVGLVNVLVWNRHTGNLVSGHQRLSILDELEGGTDYRLQVAAVDVDERTEKELNVFLNNAASMGEWDQQALAKLADEFARELDGLGFAPGELDFLTQAPPADDAGEPDGGDAKAAKKKETQDRTQVVVVFRDGKETEAFLRFIGAALDSRYVDAAKHFAKRGFKAHGRKPVLRRKRKESV
jgi:hypothetical protein